MRMQMEARQDTKKGQNTNLDSRKDNRKWINELKRHINE